jgi:hypothetical protein
MQPEQQDPNMMPNPEQEALLKVGMDSKDSLDQVAMNTEVSAMKSDEIASNTEATALAASRLQEPLEQIVENTANLGKTFEQTSEPISKMVAFLSEMKGEKGYTPVKGKDYFTDEEIDDFKSTVTPVSGIDYFTDEETEQFLKDITPVKGTDYFDGEDGYTPVKGKDYFDGKDGYTPVKGKDYFDGEPGKDGKPGRDGKDAKAIDINKIQKELETKVLKQADEKYNETASILSKKVASKSYAISILLM